MRRPKDERMEGPMTPAPRAREPFAIVPVLGVAAALGAVLLWYAARGKAARAR